MANTDWLNPQQRAAQLKVPVTDAQAALESVVSQSDNADVRKICWLVTKILDVDIVTNEQDNPQICDATAADRGAQAIVPAPSSHRAQAGRVGRERAAGHQHVVKVQIFPQRWG